MKIIIKGTKDEIARAKTAIESTCFFNSEFCASGLDCKDCEAEQHLEKEFIIE